MPPESAWTWILLAALIPIIAHLVARRPPPRVVFTGLPLLQAPQPGRTSAPRVRSTRARRVLQLLARVAACALLAAALAAPPIDPGPTRPLVLILDDSASTTRTPIDAAQPLYESLRAEIVRTANRTRRAGRDVTLIRAADAPEIIGTRALADLPRPTGDADLGAAAHLARLAVATDAEIQCFTDHQATQIAALEAASIDALFPEAAPVFEPEPTLSAWTVVPNAPALALSASAEQPVQVEIALTTDQGAYTRAFDVRPGEPLVLPIAEPATIEARIAGRDSPLAGAVASVTPPGAHRVALAGAVPAPARAAFLAASSTKTEAPTIAITTARALAREHGLHRPAIVLLDAPIEPSVARRHRLPRVDALERPAPVTLAATRGPLTLTDLKLGSRSTQAVGSHEAAVLVDAAQRAVVESIETTLGRVVLVHADLQAEDLWLPLFAAECIAATAPPAPTTLRTRAPSAAERALEAGTLEIAPAAAESTSSGPPTLALAAAAGCLFIAAAAPRRGRR